MGEGWRAPTIRQDGKRRWIYPDRRQGRVSSIRGRIAFVLILCYLIAPFIRIDGYPLIRFDITTGIISLLGKAFRFHDAGYSFFIFIIGVLALFLGTSVRGRVWCGYACPQTVWIDWVVRPIEEFIEGPAARRKAGDAAPFSWGKAGRKILKHTAFMGLAAFLSHVFLSYFVEPTVLAGWVFNAPAEHREAFLAILLLTGLIYLDFAWFREQFCAFLCPYARFQAVMMDHDTPVVSYDFQRGEPRGRRTKGDCIDCQLCVRVCPTGIDIRNGLQLECIQCSRCVDACNMVMKNLGRAPGLIREASSRTVITGGKDRLRKALMRPKNIGLSLLLLFFLSLFALRLSERRDMELVLARQPGPPYSRLDQGGIANMFRLSVTNTTPSSGRLNLKSEVSGIRLICGGCSIALRPFEEKELSLIVIADRPDVGKKALVRASPTGELLEIPLILPEGQVR